MSDYQSVEFKTPETGPDAPAAPAQNERPQWLPENFKQPEDLAKSYKELQAELTRMKQGVAPAPAAEAPAATENTPAEQPDASNDLAIKEEVEKRGVDFDALSEEFVANKTLSEESYKKLEEAGFPKELVNDYIRLKSFEADNLTKEIKGSVGGEEKFAMMVDWARKSYPPEQLKAYNSAVNSGDVGLMRQAVDALSLSYARANGSMPNLVMGANGAPSGSIYRDQAEFLRDIQDPQYKASEAFRNDVQSKLSRSNIL